MNPQNKSTKFISNAIVEAEKTKQFWVKKLEENKGESGNINYSQVTFERKIEDSSRFVTELKQMQEDYHALVAHVGKNLVTLREQAISFLKLQRDPIQWRDGMLTYDFTVKLDEEQHKLYLNATLYRSPTDPILGKIILADLRANGLGFVTEFLKFDHRFVQYQVVVRKEDLSK